QTAAATVTDHTGLVAWFANVGNGIESFFSKKITTRTLCVADDQGETCVTRDQLNTLIGNQGTSSMYNPPNNPVVEVIENDHSSTTEEIVEPIEVIEEPLPEIVTEITTEQPEESVTP
ncbi:MAG: hypothetical protein WCG20_04060, partial [bacterium]